MISLGHSDGGVSLLMDMAFEIYGYKIFDIIKNIDLPDASYPDKLYQACHYFENEYDFKSNQHLEVQFGVQHGSVKYLLHQFFKDMHGISDDRYVNLIHPKAYLAPSATHGHGLHMEPQSVVHTMANLGFGVTVKQSAAVGHHAILDDYATINPGAVISGFVEVGYASEIGTGASVSNNIKIGERCLIGAGSVVTRDIPDGVIAYGNPCKPIRPNERWNKIPYPYKTQNN